MAVDKAATRQMLTITLLCILWYIVSSSNNVIGKMILSEFPYPMTVTMVQLTSITLYSGPFFNLWGVRKYVDISWRYYLQFIVPLALGKFLASVTSHISIWKVPVSYAHTGRFQFPRMAHARLVHIRAIGILIEFHSISLSFQKKLHERESHALVRCRKTPSNRHWHGGELHKRFLRVFIYYTHPNYYVLLKEFDGLIFMWMHTYTQLARAIANSHAANLHGNCMAAILIDMR